LNDRLAFLRDYILRGLLLESEAEKFQAAGIQIGVMSSNADSHLLAESLSPFGVARRNNAIEMARLYALLHCFENEVRVLIRDTLLEKEGANWWDNLPIKVRSSAESRQKTALKDSWLEGEKEDSLGFVDFGMLASIMVEKWEFFESIIPSQHWLVQRMEELEKARHFIAHNRMLLPSEFQRMYMYIADWNRVIGL
jgi:hypothetical protein